MKNLVNFPLLIIAVVSLAFFSMPPKARAIVENQIVGFFGVTPVKQQSATQDLIVTLQTYGLVSTGTTAGITPISADHIIQSGTALLTGTAISAGTLRMSGTNLLIATGSGTWLTK